MPSTPPLLTFGIIADAQYADVDPQGERHYRSTLDKLPVAINDLNAAKVAFTLHLGDVIDRDFASYGKILPLFQKAEKPVHHLLGNHDYSVADADKAKVVATLGMPHDYYSFRSDKVRIVMLDTNAISVYKYPKDSAQTRNGEAVMDAARQKKLPEAQPWNAAMDRTQLEWLDKELTTAGEAGEIVIVAGHHPISPDSGHNLWNAGELKAVLNKHSCVRAYFNGHNHAGDSGQAGRVPCVTFRSMLHRPEVNAWAIVHVRENGLTIQGRGREVSRGMMVCGGK